MLTITNRTMLARLLVGLAALGATVLLLASAAAPGPADAKGAGRLRDVQLATEEPTDRATAQVAAYVTGQSTLVTLQVQGLHHDVAGRTFGAHVHTGPCVEGDGAAAAGHYHIGGPVNPQTEVWLDFVAQPNGTGYAEATVPFVVPAGAARSVMIHRDPTQEGTGIAGPRWACLPVEF